jgi:hypothetical protein
MSVVLRRAVLSTVVAIGVVTASGAIGLGRGSAAPASQDNSGFPDGDSKKLVLDNCGGCHDLDQVKTAKHNEAAWKETLSHMVTYGANATCRDSACGNASGNSPGNSASETGRRSGCSGRANSQHRMYDLP